MLANSVLLPLLSAVVAAAAQSQSQGCYSSPGSLQDQGTNTYQSTGSCVTTCKQYPIFATTAGDGCYCGGELPPASDKVEDSKCDIQCQGYPADICGGDGFWSVAIQKNSSVTSSPASTTISGTGSAATSMLVAPTGGMNATMTSTAGLASSTTVEYTGAATQTGLGKGVLAMGALLALF